MNRNLFKLVSTKARRTIPFLMALAIGIQALNVPVQSAPAEQSKAPQVKAQQTKKAPGYQTATLFSGAVYKHWKDRENLLLVMQNSGIKEDDMNDALKEIPGTVIGKMGRAPLEILLVQPNPGKYLEAEKKLRSDKTHFKAVSRNRRVYADYVPIFGNKEQTYKDAWHIQRMNIDKAWDIVGQRGASELITVLDSGCSGTCNELKPCRGGDVTGDLKSLADIVDLLFDSLIGSILSDKKKEKMCDRVANLVQTMSMGTELFDQHGHGTWVGTAAAGQENGRNSIGVSAGTVMAIKIADGPMGSRIFADEASILAGMLVATYNTRRPIVNISYGGLMDPKEHEVLHELFKYFYYRKNGLIFVSAGNSATPLPSRDVVYVNTVSAIGKDSVMTLAKFPDPTSPGSCWGSCVDFTAPGIDIQVTNPNGTATQVWGTSFASPIVAGVAALIWAANPRLTNNQVEQILVASCINDGRGRSPEFGFGMPDAEKAVKLARGM